MAFQTFCLSPTIPTKPPTFSLRSLSLFSVTPPLNKIVLEAQKSVGWFHDESDSEHHDDHRSSNRKGNAGFDPAILRVDHYGNVLYYHADSSSPFAWDIDHWFPCSRGGLTVPSNLSILQRKVFKKKHNKLEFFIPWWEFQMGISINQFLSIFATSNSDFRLEIISSEMKRVFANLRALIDLMESLSKDVASHGVGRQIVDELRRIKRSDATLAAELMPYNIVPLEAPSFTNVIGLFPEVKGVISAVSYSGHFPKLPANFDISGQ